MDLLRLQLAIQNLQPCNPFLRRTLAIAVRGVHLRPQPPGATGGGGSECVVFESLRPLKRGRILPLQAFHAQSLLRVGMAHFRTHSARARAHVPRASRLTGKLPLSSIQRLHLPIVTRPGFRFAPAKKATLARVAGRLASRQRDGGDRNRKSRFHFRGPEAIASS